jgi:DNA-binding LacI/PurR family transcriptional regulator
MSRADSHKTDRPPTLATVAAAAGVSRMTVSNAFNHPDKVTPALRAKVLAAAEALGYGGPDPVARTLSRGATGSVGLIFDYPLTLALNDPAMVQLLHGVAAGCEEREMGLSLVPRTTGRDAALVRAALVDGFVIYAVTADDPRVAAVRERRLPFVLIDHEPGDDVVVNIDDRDASQHAVEHLVALGHRRFAIVLGWDVQSRTARDVAGDPATAWYTASERLAGWRAGLEAAGIDWASVQVGSGPGFDRHTGRVAGGRLLDRADRPTAVLAISDQLALGILDAAAERGVAVPGALSVVGFDDVPGAALASPSLTTIRQPHAGKGAAAISLLLDGVQPPHTVSLPTELVIRSSTGPAAPQ